MSDSVVSSKLTRQATGPEMSEYIDNELYQLCEAIQDNGTAIKSGGIATIKFIDIFKIHSVVSNRLASILSKARKNGYVDFKPEILMQGKDDNEIITLKKMPRKTMQITKTGVAGKPKKSS